jgi:hypothetical protein
MRRAIGGWLLAALLSLAGCARAAAPPELWLYYGVNLADDSEVAKLEGVWRRAMTAGYRHVILADPKFAKLDMVDDHYRENVRRVRGFAQSLGLEIVPCVFQVGRANTMLTRNPNLVEGLPVRDALFVVSGGEARIVSDPPVGFTPKPDFLDSGVQWQEGVATMRDPAARQRFMFRVRVHPFRCYHVAAEVRTAQFSGAPLIQVVAPDGRVIHFMRRLGAKGTQDWTTHDLVFNSLTYDHVEIYFGVWHAARGTLEWKRARIDECGPVNLLRRAGAPFVVAGRVEGRDFEPIRDPKLGRAPYAGEFEEWHEPPPLRTSLPDGTQLRVSWHHAGIVYERQVACCLSDSGTFARLADEASRVREAFHPAGFMMMHDEIRVMNWDDACRGRGLGAGALLAEHARRCVGLLQGSRVYVWNDMFDPCQNAVRDYHLVNGDLSGSWKGLAPEVVIVNWNGDRRDESLRFFASLGHPQIIAGYYDGAPEGIRDWLKSADGVSGIIGIMYTTWRGNYDDLEAFARIVRGG